MKSAKPIKYSPTFPTHATTEICNDFLAKMNDEEQHYYEQQKLDPINQRRRYCSAPKRPFQSTDFSFGVVLI